MWDLDARPHEITLLRIKHIRLKERYGEGEIPYEAKTGSGPILLTNSFSYVRDWINEHPFRNEPDARLICNLHNGAPIKPKAIWNMMSQLHNRIIRLFEEYRLIFEFNVHIDERNISNIICGHVLDYRTHRNCTRIRAYKVSFQ